MPQIIAKQKNDPCTPFYHHHRTVDVATLALSFPKTEPNEHQCRVKAKLAPGQGQMSTKAGPKAAKLVPRQSKKQPN